MLNLVNQNILKYSNKNKYSLVIINLDNNENDDIHTFLLKKYEQINAIRPFLEKDSNLLIFCPKNISYNIKIMTDSLFSANKFKNEILIPGDVKEDRNFKNSYSSVLWYGFGEYYFNSKSSYCKNNYWVDYSFSQIFEQLLKTFSSKSDKVFFASGCSEYLHFINICSSLERNCDILESDKEKYEIIEKEINKASKQQDIFS